MSSSFKSNDLRRIFEQLDRNGDGYVSVEELHWLLNRLGVQTSSGELENVVGQKRLNLYEFLFFCESMFKPQDRESAEDGGDEHDLFEAFKVFDMNGDGFISCEELERVLTSLGLWGQRRSSDCANMICEFDSNSDGVLDFDEFKNMMMLRSS